MTLTPDHRRLRPLRGVRNLRSRRRSAAPMALVPGDQPGPAGGVAFVFQGGGSLAAPQVGMLRALTEVGLRPDLVIGSSAGALNAVAFASDPSPGGLDKIEAVWRSLRRRHVAPLSARTLLAAVAGRTDGLVSSSALRSLLASAAVARTLGDTVIPAHVVVTELASGAPVVLSEGETVPALLASCAFPGLYPPVAMGERLLVDGGVSADLPVLQAEALGARVTYVLPAAACGVGPPLPRAYEWIDGSAFLNHVILARRARGARPAATLESDPLVYQGGSGVLAGPRDDLRFADPRLGLDFEAEVAVILGDVPRGTPASQAHHHVRLVLLANDVTLRNLVPDELAKGFGFFQSKPATAFSPFAVTPDELGDAWRDGRVHLPLRSTLTRAVTGETLVGDPEAGPEMHFSFFELVAHAARTRALGAGTILGSGTVSNRDRARGVSCLAELRARELIGHGIATTPFMGVGDRIVIEMRDRAGRDLFGRIDQRVPG